MTSTTSRDHASPVRGAQRQSGGSRERWHRYRKVLTAAIVLAGALDLAGDAAANHIQPNACGRMACADPYWPLMTLDNVQKARPTGRNTLSGRKHEANVLLGWHGSDTLYGGDKSDVLWADHVGTNQPTSQVDVIYGYGGDDFIYSARGRNTIYGGPGNDAIKIRYGHGFLDCGRGNDIVNVPRSRQRFWTIRNCETIDHVTKKGHGGGLKPLTTTKQ